MATEQDNFNPVSNLPNPSRRFLMTRGSAWAAQQMIDASPLALLEWKWPGEKWPSEVFDLTPWKLTLPIGDEGDPIEITQPELAKFQHKTWFNVVTGENDEEAVRFRAPVNGETTENSKYPRSELREMTEDGSEEASWSSTDGFHSLYLDQTITAVPKNKSHLVAGQIHGEDDDILAIRLEIDDENATDADLHIDIGGDNVLTLDKSYKLGTRFTVRLDVHDGLIEVYYNDSEEPVYVHVLEKDFEGGYFKAGAYTQSNCKTEEEKALCTNKNYGEVLVYNAVITHQ